MVRRMRRFSVGVLRVGGVMGRRMGLLYVVLCFWMVELDGMEWVVCGSYSLALRCGEGRIYLMDC